MSKDRLEQMGRTTFAGQLDLEGQAAPETVVRPVVRETDMRERDVPGSNADVPLPFAT